MSRHLQENKETNTVVQNTIKLQNTCCLNHFSVNLNIFQYTGFYFEITFIMRLCKSLRLPFAPGICLPCSLQSTFSSCTGLRQINTSLMKIKLRKVVNNSQEKSTQKKTVPDLHLRSVLVTKCP